MNSALFGELVTEVCAVFVIAFGDVLPVCSRALPACLWNTCIVWNLPFTMAIHATGSISATPANPAVTLALSRFRKFPWGKVLPYFPVQVGRVGARLAYLLYSPIIDHFNSTEYLACAYGGVSGVSFTHPGATIAPIHLSSDQIVLTSFLIFDIFAITEQYSKMAIQTSQRLAPSFSTEIPVLWEYSRWVENL